MKIDYIIPETRKDIDLRTYVKVCELIEQEANEKSIVSSVLNIPFHLIDKIPVNEYTEAHNSIHKALSEDGTFTLAYTHNDIEYGFIPDFENITIGEYSALETYLKEPQKNAANILSILYRPIEYRKGEKYNIEPYNSDKDTSFYWSFPSELYTESIVFFYNLGNELAKDTLRCFSQEHQIQKQLTLVKSGGGIKHLTRMLKQLEQELITFTKSQSIKFSYD